MLCYVIISCFIRMQIGLPFWCQLANFMQEKRPLSGWVSLCIKSRRNVLCKFYIRKSSDYATLHNFVYAVLFADFLT